MSKKDWCSWWFEGDWCHCCKIHDESPQTIRSHWVLAKCVSETKGGWPMGLLMFVGLFLGGWLYRLIKRTKEWTDTTRNG